MPKRTRTRIYICSHAKISMKQKAISKSELVKKDLASTCLRGCNQTSKTFSMKCGRRFTELTNYMNHIRTHTGERPFQCRHQPCQKSFKTLAQRKNHEIRHTDDKQWSCETCKLSFYRKVDLQ